ncbi:uncharacterized protein N7483_012361 [Penicillium malachiteum]|uniref:uncharacterized protein n=1 Tax=Penicillium malachiteum TaxID=1324776 RepID=UPI00254713C0|nr:uncharacterized protein N7483_012361 [Penicillium malachiteum]KAJ5715180.1 hypothetical protein N7483_012361 [Penicillium malachiteum]
MATIRNFAVTKGRLRLVRDQADTAQDGVEVAYYSAWIRCCGMRACLRVSPFTGSKPSWESLLMLGYDLLQSLSDMRSDSDLNQIAKKPILIVCHSLGSLIVKQALCVANNQFTRYGSTVNAIAGVVFLSTPHRYGDKTTNLMRFREVLEATTKRAFKIPNENIEQEGTILLGLADRFEGISFRTPILSVYEMRESRNSSIKFRQRYQQLVNREASSTFAPMESVIGLNLDHFETCLFTKSVDGEGLPELKKFIYETLQSAGNLVAMRCEDYEYQYATMSAYSPSLSGLTQNVGQQAPANRISKTEIERVSNNATEGTSVSCVDILYPTPKNSEIRKPLHLPCILLNAHSVNEEFCGREDILERLAVELLPSKSTVTNSSDSLRQFALCGFGGIGKTEITREFSRRHKGSFDAVFWVIADEIAKLDHHYQEISLALGLEDLAESKSQVVTREIVRGWLSNPRKYLSGSDDFAQPVDSSSETTWLLVFDNADDPMILADYWPQGSGSILITSRDPLAKTMFTRRPSGLDLGPLTRQDSNSLFNNLSASSNESDDLTKQISDVLGGVPLAISQMAGIIRRQDLSFLSTVWAFEKLKFQSRQLLEVMSFVDPDVIGEDLLMKVASEFLQIEGTEFKKSNYIDARTDLLQSSLIKRDKRKQQVSVHRIIQDIVFATMNDGKKQVTIDHAIRTLWAGWPSAMPKPSKEPELPPPKSTGGRLSVGRWPDCAAIYPHVLKIHQIWPVIPNLTEATKLLFAKLLTEAAWYQKERGRTKHFDGFFDTARSICSIAMDASDFETSRIYKENSMDLVSKICKSLGTEDERLYLAYAERGKFEECNKLLLDSLAGREMAFGKNDRDSVRTGLILYALGNLRAAQKQWDDSFEYHQRAWHHMLTTVGQHDNAMGMINVALDIWSVDPSAHNNEIARSTFLKGKLFEVTGKTQKASIAFKVACRLRKQITKEDRDANCLTMQDFDEIVAFWAR